MTASSNPGPDDQDALSPWERHVLAGIEHDLAASDPRLVKELSNRGHGSAPRWWPLSAPTTVLPFVGLLVLVLVGALLPASWWAVLGIITTLVVVPWLLLPPPRRSVGTEPALGVWAAVVWVLARRAVRAGRYETRPLTPPVVVRTRRRRRAPRRCEPCQADSAAIRSPQEP